MKRFLLVALFIPVITFSQNRIKGYALVGATGFFSNTYGNKSGLSFGGGMRTNTYVSIGVGADVFIFSDNKFMQSYADVKVFFNDLDSKISPFFSIQPGWILYNASSGSGRNAINDNGSFAINFLAGMLAHPRGRKGGIFLSAGYSNLSFTTKLYSQSYLTSHSGGRLSAGLSL